MSRALRYVGSMVGWFVGGIVRWWDSSLVGRFVDRMVNRCRIPTLELVGIYASVIALGQLVGCMSPYTSLQVSYEQHVILQTPCHSSLLQSLTYCRALRRESGKS